MIACDECKEWFHGKCIRINKSQARGLKTYTCDTCVEESLGKSANDGFGEGVNFEDGFEDSESTNEFKELQSKLEDMKEVLNKKEINIKEKYTHISPIV